MRLSLKDLLAFVTFVAAIACCAAQVGFTNWLFWIYAVSALLMSWRFVRAAKSDDKRRTAWTIPILFFLGSFFLAFGSMAFWMNCGLLIVCGVVVAGRRPWKLRPIVAMTLLCMLASCVFGVYVSGGGRRALQTLREKYPIISLTPRLSYEASRRVISDPALSSSVATRLARFDRPNIQSRNWELTALHRSNLETFVSAAGFGITRLRSASLQTIERPQLHDIRFQDREIIALSRSYRPMYLGIDGSPREVLASFHLDSYSDFLDPEGFGGLINPPTEVVGFIEHGFHHPPSRYESGLAWDLERLELVSLLKFDEPRVYVLDHLPRMDQLAGDDAPTRPLDEFESAALPRLRIDEDVVIDEIAGQTRMLGSLRAAKQCTACHNAARGELLGAFSYSLRQERYPLAPK